MTSPARGLASVAVLAALGATVLGGCAAGGGESADTSAAVDRTTSASPSAPASSAPAETKASDGKKDKKKDKDQGGGDGAVAPGRYVELADYQADPSAYADSRVVLFFHATWCPDCRKADESLVTDGVPDGITVVKVDFDSATDLRQQYGVTVQHTFVAIEANGNQTKKWSGSFTGQAIADQLG